LLVMVTCSLSRVGWGGAGGAGSAVRRGMPSDGVCRPAALPGARWCRAPGSGTVAR